MEKKANVESDLEHMTSNADVTAAANRLDGPLHEETQQAMTKLAALQIHPNDQQATSLMHKQG